MVKQYQIGRWHWLLHQRNGDPSAPRAIWIIVSIICAGALGAAQAAGLFDLTALIVDPAPNFRLMMNLIFN